MVSPKMTHTELYRMYRMYIIAMNMEDGKTEEQASLAANAEMDNMCPVTLQMAKDWWNKNISHPDV